MKEITLFVQVGRAQPQPFCSASGDDADDVLAAQQAAKFASLTSGGVDPARIVFSRKVSGETPQKGKTK
jgi:hypothetical protein